MKDNPLKRSVRKICGPHLRKTLGIWFFRPSTGIALTLLVIFALSACSEEASLPTASVQPIPPNAVQGPPGGKRGGKEDPVQEDFDVWDPIRWLAGDHPLGKGRFRPENTSVNSGMLSLRLPAGTYDGGEIQSQDRYRTGSYEARIKVAKAPGSVTAFFLYEYTDRNIDEIDIEIFGDGSGRVLLVTWLRSRQTNLTEVVLPFDPTADFHDYKIEVGRKRIRFSVDGVLIQEFTQGLPSSAMHVMANVWWPTWLEGPQPLQDQAALIDWIRY